MGNPTQEIKLMGMPIGEIKIGGIAHGRMGYPIDIVGYPTSMGYPTRVGKSHVVAI